MATPAAAPAHETLTPSPTSCRRQSRKRRTTTTRVSRRHRKLPPRSSPPPSESGEESEGDDASSVASSATAPAPAAKRAPPTAKDLLDIQNYGCFAAGTESGSRIYSKNHCDNAYDKPMSGSSRKRARSTTDTTTSAPLKKIKSPVLKAIKELKDALAEMNKVGEKREEQIKQWWSQIFEKDKDDDDDDDEEEEEEEAWILQHMLNCQKRMRQIVVIGAMLAVTYFTHKKNQSPMLQAQAIKELAYTIKKMVEEMKMDQQKVDEEIKKRVEQKKVEIDRCLSMAKDCGATEDTKEYYVATKLFEEQYNRTIFSKCMTTNEERLWWLKWWCQNWSG